MISVVSSVALDASNEGVATGAPLQYTVAVRTLCEFTAKQGDLDLRFTPSATALEGQAGHSIVTSRRGPTYQAELSLAGTFGNLLVRGRADGYDPQRQQLEEIKTFRGDLSRMPGNRRALHWAQVKVYGALLCRQLDLPELQLALVYFDVATQAETVLVERHPASALQAFFEDQCRRFLAWSAQELAHRAARDASLAALRFPHEAFRPGQRPLSEAVYRAAVAGRCLMAQAPTGIGKTVGTLYPLLKACPGQRLDKVFFLAAKTPGRAVAMDALAVIAASSPALPLRVLELVARDKACEHPDKSCNGESCPLANGFYDRLPAARSEALAQQHQLGKTQLRSVALSHQVCPYYLGQELVRWADVVVGDYNHFFDTSAMLHGLTLASQWRVGVLVDEAHNLLQRARSMYSAELPRTQLRAMRPVAPQAVAPALARLDRCWADLERRQTERQLAYASYPDVPASLLSALQSVNAAIGDHLATEPAGIDPALLRFYFDTLHFTRLCESLGAHSLFDITLDALLDTPPPNPSTSGSLLCLRNIVPAPFLKPRFTAAQTVTLFSATLSPMQFHAELLGLPENVAWTELASPFSATQLKVHIVSGISTRFRHRDESLAPIVALMARQYSDAPGNYLAFFSSFDYLQKVATLFKARHPDVPVWEQTRQMTEADRARFLGRFTPESRGIGFAVLGGVFGEGIDLPGQRLIGAFIATLGMPQVHPVNEQVKTRLDTLFGQGAGHDYTYLYPGLQRVVQAAGRVIRGPMDEGSVYLIDDRFDRPQVRRLLPAWWKLPVRAAQDPAAALS